jgi:hypothetical protein
MPQIFVSYAHADNQCVDDETRGWVTHFVELLEKAINMKERGGGVHCWMNHRPEEQRVANAELEQRIAQSQCVLAFLSPYYLSSKSCREEMDAFVRLVDAGHYSDRLFLVELLPTERREWHEDLQSITAIPFWEKEIESGKPMTLGLPKPDPKAHREYWEKLNALARVMVRQALNLPNIDAPNLQGVIK